MKGTSKHLHLKEKKYWRKFVETALKSTLLNPEKHSYPTHHFVKTGFIHTCQVCDSKKLHTILDLGHQPPCDSLLSKEMLNQPEKIYPLRMIWCENCTVSQIDYCVDGKEVYHPDYPYRSGITKELAEYQINICLSLIEKYRLTPDDLAIDIGSNDGTLLKGFQREGLRVLGVEPTNIAAIAQKEGIPTIQSFFDIATAKKIKSKYGLASVITATNMFAHMQTIGEVIQGIHHLLKEDGVFVAETHYLLDVIQGGQFDTVYHEHLRTYSLASLLKLFEPYDFTVTDVERGSRYGGNIRVHVTKGKDRSVAPAVNQLLQVEKEANLDKLATYTQFGIRVQRARLEFLDFLIHAKKAGKRIVGNSCPGRCSTLLNYYGIDTALIPYLAEQPTSLKLGMYLPGKHIPVVNNQILIDEQPDYVVLMAWHYAKPIMEQLKARGLKSDFVIPLPDFRVIKNSEV
ncbi:MAG: class I SAM-dependent methyltransferase [Chlamydiales bacterium]